MTFIVFMLLFVGLCGWLDSRLPWPNQRLERWAAAPEEVG